MRGSQGRRGRRVLRRRRVAPTCSGRRRSCGHWQTLLASGRDSAAARVRPVHRARARHARAGRGARSARRTATSRGAWAAATRRRTSASPAVVAASAIAGIHLRADASSTPSSPSISRAQFGGRAATPRRCPPDHRRVSPQRSRAGPSGCPSTTSTPTASTPGRSPTATTSRRRRWRRRRWRTTTRGSPASPARATSSSPAATSAPAPRASRPRRASRNCGIPA